MSKLISKYACACVRGEVSEAGAPWCYYPQDYGYRMEGEPVETGAGCGADMKNILL